MYSKYGSVNVPDFTLSTYVHVGTEFIFQTNPKYLRPCRQLHGQMKYLAPPHSAMASFPIDSSQLEAANFAVSG
jgi:hypothetical protein